MTRAPFIYLYLSNILDPLTPYWERPETAVTDICIASSGPIDDFVRNNSLMAFPAVFCVCCAARLYMAGTRNTHMELLEFIASGLGTKIRGKLPFQKFKRLHPLLQRCYGESLNSRESLNERRCS